MYIILGKENADLMRDRYIVLELETFAVLGNSQVTSYCVVQPESIILSEMPDLDRYRRLHQATVDAWNRKDYATVIHGIDHLKGKFNGELDTFYAILLAAIGEKK